MSTNVLHTFKGFNKDLTCLGFQYEVGGTYNHEGSVVCCPSKEDVVAGRGGFHACEYPLDVFSYYPPTTSRFALVEQFGEIKKKDGDSKVASSEIKIVKEINLQELIDAAVKYTMNHVHHAENSTLNYNNRGFSSSNISYGASMNSGTQGASMNSGTQGASMNSGYRGASMNSGYRGASMNTGDRGASVNSGYRGASVNSGEYGASVNSGYRGASVNTSYRGASVNTGEDGSSVNTGEDGSSSNTGYRGASVNSGECGASVNSGYRGASMNTGDRGASVNSGECGASVNTGEDGSSVNTGSDGIAADFNGSGKVRSSAGGAIVAIFRNDDGSIRHIKAAKVGENGIKPDIWYVLDEDGNFVEVDE